MDAGHLWNRAKQVKIQTGPDIVGDFNIGFDDEIPEDVREELRSFVRWVERNFNIPVTLWVDFEYKHFLRKRDGTQAGYLIHWADFHTYPVFDDIEDIPEIRLPVRLEHWTLDEVLFSFVQAISWYFKWILNEMDTEDGLDDQELEEVLSLYLNREDDLQEDSV